MPLDSRTMSKADYVEWNLLDNAYLLCHTEPLLVQLNFLHFLMGVESVVRVLCNDIERLDVLPPVQHCESFDSYAVSEQTEEGRSEFQLGVPHCLPNGASRITVDFIDELVHLVVVPIAVYAECEA